MPDLNGGLLAVLRKRHEGRIQMALADLLARGIWVGVFSYIFFSNRSSPACPNLTGTAFQSTSISNRHHPMRELSPIRY